MALQKKQWTIYSLRVEGDDNPFYVGCTSRSNYRRWIEHKSDTTKPSKRPQTEKDKVVAKATKSGKNIIVESITFTKNEDKAFELERKWIAHYGRKTDGGVLVNNSNGGRGPSGQILSIESRRKMSQAKLGNKINVGRKRPDTIKLFSKTVSAFDESGSFVGTFNSAREASKALKLHYSRISDVLVGRIKSTRNEDGLVFQFRIGTSIQPMGPVTYKGRK